MFIRRTLRKNGSTQIKVVENLRVGENIIQKTHFTLGIANNFEEIVGLEKIAKLKIIELLNERDPVLPSFEQEMHGRSKTFEKKEEYIVDLKSIEEIKRINIGVEDVFGEVYSQLDFEDLITETRKDDEWNEILKHVVLSRLLDPTSKRKTAKEVLKDLDRPIPLEKIYRMMDRLIPKEQVIKKQIFNSTMSLLDHEVDVLLFDVTTLYFESFDSDELRNFGFSKDCKFKETQIVLALVTNNKGIPLTYEIFPGNEGEGKTLIRVIKQIKENYEIKNVVMVADRAMFVEENLSLLEEEGINYIVAAKLKTMKKAIKDKFIGDNYCPLAGSVKEIEIGNRRLIVSYSVERAKKDYKQRMRLVERLLKKSNKGKIPLKSLINNNGTKKYILVNNQKAEINEMKIIEDGQWDGIHGLITNYKADEKTPYEILERYKGLWKIEEVFRVNKNDLKMRPIYHWKPERIRAHILICFMAYTMLQTTKLLLEKQSIKLSVEELRRALSKREASIVKDKRSQRVFYVPGALTETQKQIYKAFNLSTRDGVRPI